MRKTYYFRNRREYYTVRCLIFEPSIDDTRIIDMHVGLAPNEDNYCKEDISSEMFLSSLQNMRNEAKDALCPIPNENKQWDEISKDMLSPLELYTLEKHLESDIDNQKH